MSLASARSDAGYAKRDAKHQKKTGLRTHSLRRYRRAIRRDGKREIALGCLSL